MQPIIFHLDMNSYFATVEQQDHPEWRSKVLGVCEHLGGIIIAASIEAKHWGIKTGTPVWEARRIYPKIILTNTSPDRYRLYIKRTIKIVSDYTNFVEQASIDELYADVTKVCNLKGLRVEGGGWIEFNPFEEAVDIAKLIKQRMKKEVGDYLTCSIGIAENKLLAKIGSDLKKPDGIVVVISDVAAAIGRHKMEADGLRYSADYLILSKADLYQRLKLTDIPGIGSRQQKNLNSLGIKTLVDLKNYPVSRLVARFGINGYHLHSMGQLQGSWKAEVKADNKIKSIGHMYTLPKEYRQTKFFIPVLYKLCEMVGRRMRKQGFMGNVISFYWRDDTHQDFGASKKLGVCVFDGREIFLEAMDLHTDLVRRAPGGSSIKLIGITISGLRLISVQQSLFESVERQKRVTFALDKINTKYGDFAVCRAPVLSAGKVFHNSVGFGRIKEA